MSYDFQYIKIKISEKASKHAPIWLEKLRKSQVSWTGVPLFSAETSTLHCNPDSLARVLEFVDSAELSELEIHRIKKDGMSATQASLKRLRNEMRIGWVRDGLKRLKEVKTGRYAHFDFEAERKALQEKRDNQILEPMEFIPDTPSLRLVR